MAEKTRFKICNQKSTLYERRVTQAHKTLNRLRLPPVLLKENMAGQQGGIRHFFFVGVCRAVHTGVQGLFSGPPTCQVTAQE